MKKVPFVFQKAVRRVYFDILKRFIEDEELILDLENYKDDVIIAKKIFRSPDIIAIIDSHSAWGEVDDLTNEFISIGHNSRRYEGLKIIIQNNNYRNKIKKIVDNMSRYLEEDVILCDDNQNFSIKALI